MTYPSDNLEELLLGGLLKQHSQNVLDLLNSSYSSIKFSNPVYSKIYCVLLESPRSICLLEDLKQIPFEDRDCRSLRTYLDQKEIGRSEVYSDLPKHLDLLIKFFTELYDNSSIKGEARTNGSDIINFAGQVRIKNELIPKRKAYAKRTAEEDISLKDFNSEVEKDYKFISKLRNISFSKIVVQRTDNDYLEQCLEEDQGPLYKTKYKDLDKIIGGFKPGELIVIGARPSHGKTTFALNLASNIVEQAQVLYFNLETSAKQIRSNILVQRYGKDHNFTLSDFRKGISNNKKKEIKAKLKKDTSSHSFCIETEGTYTVDKLIEQILAYVSREGVKVVIVDHAQLIVNDGLNTRGPIETLNNLTKGLKTLARRDGLVVILFSQLNRAGAGGASLENLKDSGSLEEDADVVLLLNNNYVALKRMATKAKWEQEDNQELLKDYKDKLEVMLAKNRHGETSIFTLRYNMKYGLIEGLIENEVPF